MRIIFPLIVVVASVVAGSGGHVDYEHQEGWGGVCRSLVPRRQSPIDIDTDSVTAADLGSIHFINYHSKEWSEPFVISNNGHSIQVDLPDSSDRYISGGSLPILARYKAIQFHWHWGNDTYHGSEHLINHRAYPAELHIVHTKEVMRNGRWEDDSSDPVDGYAVLGIFLDISHNQIGRNVYDKIFTYSRTKALAFDGNSVRASLPRFALSQLLPNHVDQYYRYNGGLTTPQCNMKVVWTVFKNPFLVDLGTIERFWDSFFTKPEGHNGQRRLMNNYRQPQPLGIRSIFVNDVQ